MLPPQPFADSLLNGILDCGYDQSAADDDAYDYNSENLKCVDHTAGTSISRLVTGSSAGTIGSGGGWPGFGMGGTGGCDPMMGS